MGRNKSLQKFYDYFFDDITDKDLTETEKIQLVRYRHAFHLLLENPWLPTTKLRDELMNKYDISESQAYRDINTLELLKGNVRNTAREFQQYKINSALNLALEIAVNSKDPFKIAAVASAIGKYNRLDKEPAEILPFDMIVPQKVEFTNDPEILGVKLSDKVKENPQEYVKKIIQKYTNQIELDNYIDYQEVKTDGE